MGGQRLACSAEGRAAGFACQQASMRAWYSGRPGKEPPSSSIGSAGISGRCPLVVTAIMICSNREEVRGPTAGSRGRCSFETRAVVTIRSCRGSDLPRVQVLKGQLPGEQLPQHDSERVHVRRWAVRLLDSTLIRALHVQREHPCCTRPCKPEQTLCRGKPTHKGAEQATMGV